jgi:peptidoglycan/LPS O-acetylase OafA/YrhL
MTMSAVVNRGQVGYPILDFLRAASAALVCMGHARALVMLPYRESADQSFLFKCFYFLTGFGHEAVMIFFVISGFLIGRSVYLAKLNNTWNWKSYAIDRLSRLWMVLLPALVLTLILDSIGISKDTFGYYVGSMATQLHLGPQEPVSLSSVTFFSNLFFIQNIASPIFGSNGPLWSLANEFWYYVLFPLLLGVILPGKGKLFSAIAIVPLALFVGWPMIMYGSIWLFGCLAPS